MNGYFLDTSVIIDYLRGRGETVSTIEKLDGEVCSSFICLAELFEGVAREKESGPVEEKILGFFGTFFEVFGLDEDISRRFGEIRALLKNKGKILEDLDIFIAATCLANDLVLVTGNKKHFSRVENLPIREI